jgi:hypothetical protein
VQERVGNPHAHDVAAGERVDDGEHRGPAGVRNGERCASLGQRKVVVVQDGRPDLAAGWQHHCQAVVAAGVGARHGHRDLILGGDGDDRCHGRGIALRVADGAIPRDGADEDDERDQERDRHHQRDRESDDDQSPAHRYGSGSTSFSPTPRTVCR